MDYKSLIKKPKSARGLETLNRLLSAAAQVFYEKGYHGANITDITNTAGLAAGTIYVYFDSKYNLYKFLLFECGHMIRKHLHSATRNCTTRYEAERAGMHAWLEFVTRNRYVYHIIWESLYVDKQLFIEYYKSFSTSYMKAIERGKENGEIRSDIGSDVLAWTLMGASNFLGLNWGLFKDYAGDLNQTVDDFMKIISGAFTAPALVEAKYEQSPIQIRVEFDDEDEFWTALSN